MPRGQKFKAEEIIAKLREAEVELARGKKVLQCGMIIADDVAYVNKLFAKLNDR